jgi:hypothetical protein
MWHAWGRGEVFTGFWLGGPKVKRPLERPRRRWEYNIKMDVREIGIDEANWIQVAQGRGPVVGFCEHCNEPSGSIRKQDFFDNLSDKQLLK